LAGKFCNDRNASCVPKATDSRSSREIFSLDERSTTVELLDQGLGEDDTLEGWVAPRAPSRWNPLADTIRDDLCVEVRKSRPAAQSGRLKAWAALTVQFLGRMAHDEPDRALTLWSQFVEYAKATDGWRYVTPNTVLRQLTDWSKIPVGRLEEIRIASEREAAAGTGERRRLLGFMKLPWEVENGS
jgi:hypothetical protein